MAEPHTFRNENCSSATHANTAFQGLISQLMLYAECLLIKQFSRKVLSDRIDWK